MTPKFRAQIIAKRITLFPGERELYNEHLRSLEGKNVQVVISKVKGLRTEQQMRYYWGVVVKMIADYTGDDPDSIHAFLKDKFAPKVTVTIKEEARVVPGCTHDLFKDNFFDDYVDRIRAWSSAELSIVIPDPQKVAI